MGKVMECLALMAYTCVPIEQVTSYISDLFLITLW